MSTRWSDLPSRRRQRIVRRVLERDGYVCTLQLDGCTHHATEADHVRPNSAGGSHHDDNLAAVCRSCNAARRDGSTGGDGRFGARVVVVIGPPAAGKTTHAHRHAGPADLVVDFDALALALAPAAMVPAYLDDDPETAIALVPEHVREVAAAARDAAITAARWLPVDCTVWLIHALPSVATLTRYRRDGWQIVVCDPGEETVRDRITRRRPELQPANQLGCDRWYGSTTAAAVAPSREW